MIYYDQVNLISLAMNIIHHGFLKFLTRVVQFGLDALPQLYPGGNIASRLNTSLPIALGLPDLVLLSGKAAKLYDLPEVVKRGSLPFGCFSNV